MSDDEDVRPAKFNWKDCNMVLFGTDTENQVNKETAQNEVAWKNAGQTVGIQIFRIFRYKIEKWPVEDHGKFYNGDSYIVLRTQKGSSGEELAYNVHFWIGKYSSTNDYQTAALKMAELDSLLDDKPVQHREVQGQESDLFKSYFEFFTIMKGTCETGFRRTGANGYKMRLFQIVGERRQISVTQVPFKKGNLNSEDVFVIDQGLRIYQFNGETANKDEKFRATMYVNQIKGERMGKPRLDILEEKSISPSHRFYKLLPEGTSKEKEDPAENTPELHKVSDNNGTMEIDMVSKGSINRSDLKSSEVYIVSTPKHCFVWIGSGAPPHEYRSSMGFAHKFLKDQTNPFVPVTVMKEGQRNPVFAAAF